MTKIKILLLVVASSLLLAGCATPVASDRIKAESLTLQNHHPFSVSVSVAGGRETNPLWVSEVSNDAFAQAIRDSIASSGLFRSVVSSGEEYSLAVEITKVSEPGFGIDMTYNLTANWVLTRLADQKIMLQEEVAASHTATMGDAFIGAVRWKLAEEGAARANIEDGLTRISQLKLAEPAKPVIASAPVIIPPANPVRVPVAAAPTSVPVPAQMPTVFSNGNSTYTLQPDTPPSSPH